LVNANDSDGDRIPAATSELDYLVSQIVDHTINLLDHGLRKYFYLYANLHSGDWTSSDLIASIEDRDLSRNDLAKCPVTSASVYTPTSILNVQRTIFTKYGCVNKLRRSSNGDQIFVKMHRHEVALIRGPMFVDFAFKEAPELAQKPIFA
jgi:hypothetical protein